MATSKGIEKEKVNASAGETENGNPEVEIRNFEPARHLVNLRGGEYLEVKWRLLWLRTEYPNASIETEMVHFDPENRMAVFKARVTIPENGSATGWGSESSDDFKDFIEKAETKALGRALAACGFGTQFTHDYEYDGQNGQGGRVVDAPVSYPPIANGFSRPANSFQNGTGNNFGAVTGNASLATEKQVKFIYSTGREQGLSEDQIASRSREKFGMEPEKLSKGNASRFIDLLRQPA